MEPLDSARGISDTHGLARTKGRGTVVPNKHVRCQDITPSLGGGTSTKVINFAIPAPKSLAVKQTNIVQTAPLDVDTEADTRWYVDNTMSICFRGNLIELPVRKFKSEPIIFPKIGITADLSVVRERGNRSNAPVPMCDFDYTIQPIAVNLSIGIQKHDIPVGMQ